MEIVFYILVKMSKFMKLPKTKYVIMILFLLGLLTSVWYFWLNPKKAINLALPNLNQLSSVNTKIMADTAYINVIGIIENKAIYKISIDHLAYNIKLADTKLISEKQKINLYQSPGAKDTVALTFRLPISKTRSLIQKLQKKDSTYLTANFEITYNTIFGKTTIPFSKNIDIKVPTPPEIKLIKIKAGNINLKQKNVDLNMVVSIKNNSDKIKLCLRDLVYNVKIGQNINGKGECNETILVEPLSTVNAILPINVTVNKPLQAFWKIVANKEVMSYEINMDGILVNDTVQNIPISLNAKGNTQLLK